MSRLARARLLLALVFAFALVLRLMTGLWWEKHLGEETRFGFGDSETYWVLGQAIAEGKPYQFGTPELRCMRTPGYPVILAAIFRAADCQPPLFWARAVGAIWGTLAVGGVYWLARQLFGPSAALIAAIGAAIYPGAIAMSAFILTEAPFSALMLLQLIFWTVGWKSDNTRRSAAWMLAAGFVAGLATLVRPSWLLFVPFAIVVAIVFSPERRRHARSAAFLLLGLVIAMSPWWIRNARLYGRFVPTTLQVGASLYDGLNPQADGGSNMDFVPVVTAELLRAAPADGASTNDTAFEVRLDREFRRRALDWATQHPLQALQLAGMKFLRMWNVWPNEPSFRSCSMRAVVLLSYVPVLALTACGAWKYCRQGWPYVLCLLPAIYFTLLHVVFVSSIRYRQPVMLTAIVLAAAVLAGVERPESRDKSS